MNNEEKETGKLQDGDNKNDDKQKPVPQHNPFEPGDDKQITQEDIDNEQKFKEAMTERD